MAHRQTYALDRQVKWELVTPCNNTEIALKMPGLSRLLKAWKHQAGKPVGKRMLQLRTLLAGCTTSISDSAEPLPHDDIPVGLKYFPLDGSHAVLLSATARELDHIFSDLSRYNTLLNVDAVSIIEDEGKIYWPSWSLGTLAKHPKRDEPINTANVLAFLQDNHFNSILQLFKYHYYHIIDNIYAARKSSTMSKEDLMSHINQNSSMQFLKYAPNTGMKQHIDNQLRCPATVITIGVGRKVVYDVSPVLHQTHKHHGQIVRVTLPEGSSVVMNDDVRYHWTHGIPEEKDGSIKYTIIWMLHHTPEMLKNHIEVRNFSSILGCDTYALRFSD